MTSRRRIVKSSAPRKSSVPRNGFGIRPGVNPPLKVAYATPEFAARQAAPDWTIFDWATGETVGRARDFGQAP